MSRLDDTLKWMLDRGIPGDRVPDAEAARRMGVCMDCPMLDPGPVKCRICGCYMEVKTRLVVDPVETAKNFVNGGKVALKKTRCPEGRWEEWNG